MSSKIRHSSYGKVAIYRSSSNRPVTLFGTDLTHKNTIRLEVHRAVHERSINEDYYLDEDKIVEVEMSPVQFAELITNMNTTGVPCTIKNVKGTPMEACPYVSKIDTLRNESNDNIKEVSKSMRKLSSEVVDLLKTKKIISKSDREHIIGLLGIITSGLDTDLDYISERCQEQINNMTLQAKSEIEAYIANKIQTLGLEELSNQVNIQIGE